MWSEYWRIAGVKLYSGDGIASKHHAWIREPRHCIRSACRQDVLTCDMLASCYESCWAATRYGVEHSHGVGRQTTSIRQWNVSTCLDGWIGYRNNGSLRSPDVGTMSERVVHIGEVSERCRSKTVSDRHGSDTVSESERCSDTAPTPCRSSIGVGEVLRYCSDTVSESERCSDTVPTQCRSRIGAEYQ